MSKKNKSAVEEQSIGTEVTENQVNEAPVNEAPVNEAPVNEAPVEEVKEESEEVKAKRAEIAGLEEAIKAATEALKNQRKSLKTAEKELKALIEGVKVVSGKKYVFVSNGKKPEEIKMANGKNLSYQAKLLVTILIGDAPEGTEIEMTKEEILAKLEGYPCVGDVWDNFAWYKSQVLTPLGLMKK
jgi:hypothetical protein